MKPFIAMLVMLSACPTALAESVLMVGGRSPDGRYEVRISRVLDEGDRLLKRDATGYAIGIYQAGDSKPLHTLESGGHLHYTAAVERCRALWHSSSRFVAISDEPARHSREFDVFDVSTKPVRKFELADYVQNALGRIDATDVDLSCVSTPKRWDGDDLVVELYFTAKERHSYTCGVTFHLHGLNDSVAYLLLKQVTQPKGNEG